MYGKLLTTCEVKQTAARVWLFPAYCPAPAAVPVKDEPVNRFYYGACRFYRQVDTELSVCLHVKLTTLRVRFMRPADVTASDLVAQLLLLLLTTRQ